MVNWNEKQIEKVEKKGDVKKVLKKRIQSLEKELRRLKKEYEKEN